MNSIYLPLTPVAAVNYNDVLAEAFDIPLADDVMFIPVSAGKGMLYKKKIDHELFLVFWKYVLRKKLVAFKRPVNEEKYHSVSIVYLLEGNVRTGLKESTNQRTNTIMLVSDKSALKFQLPPDELLKMITIDIGTEWLKAEFSVSSRFYATYFNALYKKINVAPLVYTATMEEAKLLSEIEGQINMGSENLLYLKAKTFLLISEFFSRFIKRPLAAADQQKLLHHEKMLEAEKILEAHLEKKLPELAFIAKQLSISVSTLKRHFKITFGNNIYQYYLELKMNYARKLMTDKSLPVNEVAAMLQYENVSGFIEMFKKHHGISPGALIKGEQ